MAFSPQEWSDDIRTKGQTCSKSCWNVSRFSIFSTALFNALDTICSGRRRTTLSMVTAIATREWVPKPWVQRRTIGAGAMERWTPTWATWWTLWTTWWGTMGWDLVCLCYVCVCFCIWAMHTICNIVKMGRDLVCSIFTSVFEPIDLSCEIIIHRVYEVFHSYSFNHARMKIIFLPKFWLCDLIKTSTRHNVL